VSAEGELLRTLVACLEGRDIPYMLTGSVASSHHGRPRTTQDVDVVIDPTLDTLAGLVEDLLGEPDGGDAMSERGPRLSAQSASRPNRSATAESRSSFVANVVRSRRASSRYAES